MEIKEFEIILTEKNFDKCCSFYQGILSELKISVASNFLMKFVLPGDRVLKLCIIDPMKKDFVPSPAVLNFKLAPAGIERALEYLMQHNFRFITEKNTLRTIDPAGNILSLSGSDIFDFNSIRPDQKTRKVDLT